MSMPLRPASLLACLALGACATGLPTAGPSEIAALRQRVEVAPDDARARTRLGIALYAAAAYDEAVVALEEAIARGATDGAAHLYLGLAHEEMGRWSEAREAYAAFLGAGGEDSLQDDVRGRLALMARRELEEAARAALAQEARLSSQPPAPRSVAVFPFRLVSERGDLEPLQVALADMMITDLTLAGDLTVLERTQIQTLLDEMALTQAGYTEAATGARAGRLLRAEHVVQGVLTTLGPDVIRFDADVLDTRRAETTGEVSDQERLASIFDLEKQVVFEVLGVLGVDMTPAEREAINENRAENLLSFLAYGRGLEALDRGDYAQAARFFQQSIDLDPGFQPAQEHGERTSSVASAVATPPSEVPGSVGGVTGAPVPSIGGGIAATLAGIDNAVNPSPTMPSIGKGSARGATGEQPQQGQQRDPVQESTGQETPTGTATATIRITIPRPGGGQ